MNTILSFTINHDILEPGLYLSRVDGDVFTYDLRFVRPNTPPFMEQAAMHTLEHLFATIARNGDRSDNVIYFGPMGCRTGFYLLTRGLRHSEVIDLVVTTINRCASWSDEIPGAQKIQCGNWLEHDLDGAKALAAGYAGVISRWTQDMLEYPQ